MRNFELPSELRRRDYDLYKKCLKSAKRASAAAAAEQRKEETDAARERQRRKSSATAAAAAKKSDLAAASSSSSSSSSKTSKRGGAKATSRKASVAESTTKRKGKKAQGGAGDGGASRGNSTLGDSGGPKPKKVKSAANGKGKGKSAPGGDKKSSSAAAESSGDENENDIWEMELIDSDDDLDSFTLASSIRTFSFGLIWRWLHSKGWIHRGSGGVHAKRNRNASFADALPNVVYVAPECHGGGVFPSATHVVNWLDGEGEVSEGTFGLFIEGHDDKHRISLSEKDDRKNI